MVDLTRDAIPFVKMHGLGNDFVVVDARQHPFAPDAPMVRALSDRRTGIGCDQLIIIEAATAVGEADVAMRIRNADGGVAGACGNATRCIASLIMDERASEHVIIETVAGLLEAERTPGGLISVDMGRVALDWRDVPLSEPADTLHLGISAGPLVDPVALSVGNPHAVFFVDHVERIPLEMFGPVIERHPLFPEFTNVEAVEVLSRERLRMRVWERGAGLTRACGTGACAALVAAVRRGLAERKAEVVLDGGTLTVEWLRDNHVLLTGPAATSFRGVMDSSLLP